LPNIYFAPKKLGILCFDQKLPAKPKWSKTKTPLYTVSQKRLILKNRLERNIFSIFKASGGCGEIFLKIGDDFGAGR
jgi:hypothetical protein